jgi:hypothetical protein
MRRAYQHRASGVLYRQDRIMQLDRLPAIDVFTPGSEKSAPDKVKDIQSFSPTHPNVILIVGVDTVDMVIQKRNRIPDHIPENLERVPIIPVESVVGAEPHESTMILVDTGHGIVGQPLVDAQISY